MVDLDACFFSPRLATERLRVARAVGRGERVLCLFAGCGAEALIIAATTECERVVAVEANAIATRCLGRSVRTGVRRVPTVPRLAPSVPPTLCSLEAPWWLPANNFFKKQ